MWVYVCKLMNVFKMNGSSETQGGFVTSERTTEIAVNKNFSIIMSLFILWQLSVIANFLEEAEKAVIVTN